ncbi:O-fucosyltransferase 6 [Dionaea muscipula]
MKKQQHQQQQQRWKENGCFVPSSNGFIIHASLFRRATTMRRHRRRQLLHLAPVLSIVFVVLLLTFLSPPAISSGHILPRRNLGGALSSNRSLWTTSSSEFYYGCSAASKNFLTADAKTEPNRYLLISTSGGLNQQRTGIVDAVVAAYILNATLVVPVLDRLSYWKDSSNFDDIFNVDWFISFLMRDVRIIKQLPTGKDNTVIPYRTRVPRKCTPTCYLQRVLPLLNTKHAVQLTKFDFRLSNTLETDLQKLRCRVNYHALRFTHPILEMGNKLLGRMRIKDGHFVALHLRFEPDMLAFSGCDYGGGEVEKKEFGIIRKRWKTLHTSDPEKRRRQGRCPLTPMEVGLMLRALGFGSDVHLYVASGEIHGGQKTLEPLKALFPNLHSKYTLSSKEELAPFMSYSSRMAALDFIVCDQSDVFIANNNGNMAKILAGRRRYFGHKPTIRPNAKKLYPLFVNLNNMTWEEFSIKVRTHQLGFMGGPNEVMPGVGEFHENPAACICDCSLNKARGETDHLQRDPVGDTENENGEGYSTRNDAGEASDHDRTDY